MIRQPPTLGEALARIEAEASCRLDGKDGIHTICPGETWTLTIPNWHPTSDNKLVGKNRYVAHGRKRNDALRLLKEAQVAGIPPAHGKRRVSVVYYRNKGRMPDVANFNKSLHDALVKVGLLVDDSGTWAEFPPPEIETGKKATVITLEDIA